MSNAFNLYREFEVLMKNAVKCGIAIDAHDSPDESGTLCKYYTADIPGIRLPLENNTAVILLFSKENDEEPMLKLEGESEFKPIKFRDNNILIGKSYIHAYQYSMLIYNDIGYWVVLDVPKLPITKESLGLDKVPNLTKEELLKDIKLTGNTEAPIPSDNWKNTNEIVNTMFLRALLEPIYNRTENIITEKTLNVSDWSFSDTDPNGDPNTGYYASINFLDDIENIDGTVTNIDIVFNVNIGHISGYKEAGRCNVHAHSINLDEHDLNIIANKLPKNEINIQVIYLVSVTIDLPNVVSFE